VDSMHSATAIDLIATGKSLLTVSAADTLDIGLKKLSEARVLSAPVMDGTACLGLLDLGDIAAFLVHQFYHKAGIHHHGPEAAAQLASKTFHGSDMDTGMSFRMHKTPVKEIINYSKQNPYVTVPSSTPLVELARILSTGPRRVVVVDADNHLLGLIPQSGIVRYLVAHPQLVPAHFGKTLEELKLARKPVITIPESCRTLDAYALMHAHNFSGIALVNSTGRMSGNISLKDMHPLTEDWARLLSPANDYVHLIRREALRAVNPTITVHPTEPLTGLMARLVSVNVHRIYVDDGHSDLRLIGVVSLRDVLSQMIAL